MSRLILAALILAALPAVPYALAQAMGFLAAMPDLAAVALAPASAAVVACFLYRAI